MRNVGLIFHTLQAHIETECFNSTIVKLIYYTQSVHDHWIYERIKIPTSFVFYSNCEHKFQFGANSGGVLQSTQKQISAKNTEIWAAKSTREKQKSQCAAWLLWEHSHNKRVSLLSLKQYCDGKFDVLWLHSAVGMPVEQWAGSSNSFHHFN